MNSSEIDNLISICCATIGGMLTARGVATSDQISTATSNLSVIVPALISLAGIARSIYSHWNMKKVPENAVPIDPAHLRDQGAAIVPGVSVNLKDGNGNIWAKVASIFLIGVIIGFMMPGDALAQGGKFRSPGEMSSSLPFPIPLPGQQTKQVDILKALDAQILPDLEYALRIAKATNSNLTANCYQAWIDIITARQKSLQDDKGTEIPEPSPHVITDFEKAVEIRNALQPESPFMVACSPVANMIKTDIISFMGKVLAGGAGIAALVPGL